MHGMDIFWGPGRRVRVGPVVGLAVATALLMSALFAGTAAASHVECGEVITTNTTLDSDLGPCPEDGLRVAGNDITLDLGGHRVFADNGPEETVGIRLMGVTGATVQNGTVEGFDAGVAVGGGGRNTIQRITAQNNVNDMDEPFVFVRGQGTEDQPDVGSGPGQVTAEEWNAQMLCDYGDGITTFASDDNVIRRNRVIGNGPYGGITLVDDSDNNLVEKNRVLENNVANWTTRNTPTGPEEGSGLCGATLPGAPGMQRGREVQAIGIRIEGPNANDNEVAGNSVDKSALVGISIHSYVCQAMPGEPRADQEPNSDNLITKNKVRRTGEERRLTEAGFVSAEEDDYADGIASMAQGPIGTITCTSWPNTIVGNNSSDNDRNGVALHETVQETVVNRNVANKNGGSGVFVAGPRLNEDGTVRAPGATSNTLHRNRAHQNAEFDGFDGNEDCDENSWLFNRFLTVNQPCVASRGTGSVGGPGKSGDAPKGGSQGLGSRPGGSG